MNNGNCAFLLFRYQKSQGDGEILQNYKGVDTGYSAEQKVYSHQQKCKIV